MFQRSSLVIGMFAASTLLGCPSGGGGTKGGGRSGFPAPGWFNKKPKGLTDLFFVGDTSAAPDESTARELAIQKAFTELITYCGANMKSDFKINDVEENGKRSYNVSASLDVAGDEITVERAEVSQVVVGKGSDGSFDAYALLKWPKEEFGKVQARKTERAERALALYLEAETAAKGFEMARADDKLKEARGILGDYRSQIPLKHERLKNSALLWDTMEALKERLKKWSEERKKIFAVNVICTQDAKAQSCPSHRIGAIREKVSSAGFKVSSKDTPRETVDQIIDSGSPQTTADIRSVGHVLAVRYEAKFKAKEDGFVFVRCSGRGVVFDTDANKVVKVKQVSPQKGGHVRLEGAVKKGCNKVEKELVQWLSMELNNFKSSP